MKNDMVADDWPEALNRARPVTADFSRATREECCECTMVAALDGRVLSSSGDVRTFFNCSPATMTGRDVYLFFEKDRLQIKRSIDALAPNVTIDRDVIMRPRERRPRLVRATISRLEDDETIYWKFASV